MSPYQLSPSGNSEPGLICRWSTHCRIARAVAVCWSGYLSVPQSPIRNMCCAFGSGAGAGFGLTAWPANAKRGAVAASAEKAKVWRRNWRRFSLGSNGLDIRLSVPYGTTYKTLEGARTATPQGPYNKDFISAHLVSE